ncbi:MAG TPA: DUF6702 family protein [Gemmatimonadales bacterium]|nr:DUF6702 family protein [Gemmatimonadales bacterium]
MKAVICLLAALEGSTPVHAHPLHTTLTTIEWQPDRRALQIAVRVFTQDLREALSRGSAAPDSAVCRYARGAIVVRDGSGRPLQDTRCTVQDTADVTWIRLETPAVSLASASVLNAFLFESFNDQVNVVQARVAGGRRPRTIVFTKGDGPKPIGA